MERLKLLRGEKGISQEKLAEKVGSSQQLIHKYEHGSEPDIEAMKRIANFFNTSIDYFGQQLRFTI
ncbi:MAG: helix-turn-helix domain-containing protein [Defluviitaleaceae bacterium]|nr:helix-turn-helix domain-containing protein [Defluviitaleaceae bacterium]